MAVATASNSGLWGGLWCLPIFENRDELVQLCQSLGLKQVSQRAKISHSFTHFTWQLEALCFEVDADQARTFKYRIGQHMARHTKRHRNGHPNCDEKIDLGNSTVT